MHGLLQLCKYQGGILSRRKKKGHSPRTQPCEAAYGRKSDTNHPNKVLYFPKPDYWFWPELEDEGAARKMRGLPRRIMGLRRHVYLTDGRILKPY